MAKSIKNIKRFGSTPVYGLQHEELTDVGSGVYEEVLFATNISWSSEIKDYEQLNFRGQSIGYMITDAQLNWSMQANVNHDYEGNFGDFYHPAQELILSNDIGKQLLESEVGLGYDPQDAVSILKTVNITQTNDGAAELSLDGTIYYFPSEHGE